MPNACYSVYEDSIDPNILRIDYGGSDVMTVVFSDNRVTISSPRKWLIIPKAGLSASLRMLADFIDERK